MTTTTVVQIVLTIALFSLSILLFLYTRYSARKTLVINKILYRGSTNKDCAIAANSRRDYLNNLINSNFFNSIVESPPGTERFRQEIYNDTDFFVVRSKLQWQIAYDHLLLGERLVDTIEYVLNDTLRKTGKERRFPAVSLYPSSHVSVNDYPREISYPWVAVIHTSDTDFWASHLRTWTEWLAIPIAFSNPFSLISFGACIDENNGKMPGILGGIVASQARRMYMTCEHILERHCTCAILRTNSLNESLPDLALISGDKLPECSDIVSAGSRPIGSASVNVVDACMRSGGTVRTIFPKAHGANGRIISRVLAHENGGKLSRFSHLQILPTYTTWQHLFRIFKKPFAQPGDSGSWVEEKSTGKWLGMLTGGIPVCSMCFIAEASLLQEFIKHQYPTENIHFEKIIK